MQPHEWSVIKSVETDVVTRFKHYFPVKSRRVVVARCGMVHGTKQKGFRFNFLRRKCIKCKVSFAADLKKGIV